MDRTWILTGLLLLVLPAAVGAQEAVKLSVDEMVFCTGVQDRTPMGVDTAFASSVGQCSRSKPTAVPIATNFAT